MQSKHMVIFLLLIYKFTYNIFFFFQKHTRCLNNMIKRVIMGSDHAGITLKNFLKDYLK